jgi:hypothetical protein
MRLPVVVQVQTPRAFRSIFLRAAGGLPVTLALAPFLLLGQTVQTGGEAPESTEDAPAAVSEHMTTAPVANALRATGPIQIDGRPDEAAWLAAPAITDFTQIEPNDGAPATQRTEVRILYDDDNLYVAAWLYDTGPLTARLGRRDSRWPDVDSFILFLDTYHDHRTAYRFTVNPSGVIRDEIVTGGGGGGGGPGGGGPGGPSGTGFGDDSWDPVWEVRTSTSDEGWFVEMRIPFSQVRFAPSREQVWGLQIDRRIGRNLEHVSWSWTSRLERATVGRFGHLHGISDIRSSGRLELLPYVAARAEYLQVPRSASADFDNPFRSGSDYFGDTGLDLKYRIGSNLTLDATINPDFGQVEMDPAEINLTAFETRLGERRPFFVEGADIFNFGTGGGLNTNIVYTRRVGRSPQIPTPQGAAYSDVPGAATILGAVKLTGTSSGGWSGGVMQAYTPREFATWIDTSAERHRSLVEPATNYLVGRVRRDLNEGATAVGIVGTSVHRSLGSSEAASNRLHSSAFSGGIDFRQEWDNRRWVLSGELTGSMVRGEAAALVRTQRSSARYFHRPDADHLDLDPEATSMAGYAGKLAFSRETGAWRGGTTFTAIHPSYETNDLGFQTAADRIDLRADFGYQQTQPGNLLRTWSVRGSSSGLWNFGGERLGTDVNLNGNLQLLSYYGMNGRIGYNFSSWDDRFTRGGPLTRSPAQVSGNLGFNTDTRRMLTVRLNGGFSSDDAGGWRWNLNANTSVQPSEAVSISGGPSFSRNHSAAQFLPPRADALATQTYGTRYLFAPLDQSTLSFNTRVNVTFSPTLTLEMNAEPLIGSGRYGSLMELAAPRTFDFLVYGEDVGTISRGEDGRYTVDPDGDGPAGTFQVNDPDFTVRSLLGSAVLRWEWRPGSTLFLVWQQVRSERLTGFAAAGTDRQVGDFSLGDDVRGVFGLKPENVFMLKMTYWLNP